MAANFHPAVMHVPLNTQYMMNPYVNPLHYQGHSFPYPYPYEPAPMSVNAKPVGSLLPAPYPYPYRPCTQELCVQTPIDG